MEHDPQTTGFHEGELSVQERFGVRGEARRLVRMLDPADLRGAAGFLSQQTFLVITARAGGGTLWTSPLTGPAGFLQVTGTTGLDVAYAPAPGDPLADLPAGQQVGLLTIDFAKRRRFRLNGHLAAAGRRGLSIEVEQAYGNCPQYIQRRDLTPSTRTAAAGPMVEPSAADRLTGDDIEQVRAADTFFLGTEHPTRGADASHRGGPAGIVRVEDDRTLWWPDYPGNNMFNSLGNLAVDPTAALLFVDPATGRTLHLTGDAETRSVPVGDPGDEGRTGRRVWFHLTSRRTGVPLGLRVRA